MSFDLCFWDSGTGTPEEIYDDVCEGDDHRLTAGENVLQFRDDLLDRWSSFTDFIDPSGDDYDDDGRPANLDRYVLLTIPFSLLDETAEIFELARRHRLTGYDPQAEQQIPRYLTGVNELAEVQQAFDDAERHGRTEVLQSLLADDFRSIGERGYVLDKAAWIARFGDFRYLSREVTGTEVRHYPGTAIVRGVERSEAIWQGRTMTLSTRTSQVWIVHPDGWKLVALQFSSWADS